MTEKLLGLIPCHRLESRRRPAEVFWKVFVNERLEPDITSPVKGYGRLPYRLLIGFETDDVAMIVEPVLDVFVLTVLAHELRGGVSRLRNPLTLGQLLVEDDIEGLIH